MALSRGLGGLEPVREDPRDERLPTATLLELRRVARTVRDVADQIDPNAEEDDGDRPSFMRGEFGANLAEEIPEYVLSRIASELLLRIDADLASRKDWEEMVTRAIRFLGLIYEEASGEMSSEGSVSKAWHTLMLEAAIGFWANAHAEFLPATGPVKVRDDEPQIGHNGGPPLDEQGAPTRTELAEAFELDFNHYLTVGDKQYYRDFSRMLWSLVPKGTEFRKIYYHPLRKMVVSEWVKSENLIVSNEAADLSTAGRITERIMMRPAEVARMQWKGFWRDVELTQPVNQPTEIQETVARTEGIRARVERPEDQPYTIYECSCELDLEGYRHEDEDGPTGLPLPYIVTLDRDSRQVLRIVRNWKEDDEDFLARQRYVMFGLLPGFGLYFLGFSHILGNTERALTALEREVIDNTMLSIFPSWLSKKGLFSRGGTQVRMGPSAVKEVDLGMSDDIRKVLMSVPVPQVGPAVTALFEKLEDNGRKLVGQLELPVGEGMQNIPVGTMIAVIEQSTKVMQAVHKGMHASRMEEFELMRELIAEDPSVLERVAQSEVRWSEMVDEFMDLDLVPSSDPNTPSHVHRVMQFIGLGQLAQMFPDIANRMAIYKEGLSVLRVGDPQSFVNPNPQPMPDPKAGDQQAKLAVAQLNAQSRERDTAARTAASVQQQQGKIQEALIDANSEKLKAEATMFAANQRTHDSAREQAMDLHQQNIDAMGERTHDLEMQRRQQLHEQRQQTMQPQPTTPSRQF